MFSRTDSVNADATNWREGGNKGNSPNSPADQEGLGQEDGNATPAEQNDGQKAAEKRDPRLPQVPQPKLNGQQQPPISSQYRAMMPPYVSDGYTKSLIIGWCDSSKPPSPPSKESLVV